MENAVLAERQKSLTYRREDNIMELLDKKEEQKQNFWLHMIRITMRNLP